jgi:hypothetical protein
MRQSCHEERRLAAGTGRRARAGGHPCRPRLDSYTTLVTYVLDLAIVTPAVFLCSVLLLRRAPLGYLLAFPLLGIIVLLAPAIAAQTISQVAAGVSFTPGEVVGPMAGFASLGLIALWLLIALLRNIADTPPARTAQV